MKDFNKGIVALLLAMLMCGIVILVPSLFLLMEYTSEYYNIDIIDYCEIATKETSFNTGLALLIGASFGLGVLKGFFGEKDTSEKEDEDITDQQTAKEDTSKTEENDNDMIECIFCKAKIHKDQVLCNHCGRRQD